MPSKRPLPVDAAAAALLPTATTSPPAGRRGRPPRDAADQVQRRLLDAARALFVQRGFDATSMDAVAAEARTSKRTLYERYPGKEQLFAAVVSDHISQSFAPVHEALAAAMKVNTRSKTTETDDPVQRIALRDCLIEVGNAFVAQALAAESQALDRAVFAAAHALPELADRLHQDGFLRAIAIVGGLLAQAGARQPTLAAQSFYALLVLMPMRGDSPGPTRPQPDVPAVVDFVLAGAFNTQGLDHA